LEQIRAAASELTLLNDFREQIRRADSMRETFDAAVECVRQLTPANVIALYRYRPDGDIVTADLVAGDPSGLLSGFNIKLGQRVTGWCGANRTTAVNSVASLDLAQIANQFVPALRSVMSVPLAVGDSLVGVLTGYSARDEAFSPEHVYVWEQVAVALTRRLAEIPGPGARAEVTRFSRDNIR
jgi:GAF domain-containing protein